jgi:hypothetical protein
MVFPKTRCGWWEMLALTHRACSRAFASSWTLVFFFFLFFFNSCYMTIIYVCVSMRKARCMSLNLINALYKRLRIAHHKVLQCARLFLLYYLVNSYLIWLCVIDETGPKRLRKLGALYLFPYRNASNTHSLGKGLVVRSSRCQACRFYVTRIFRFWFATFAVAHTCLESKSAASLLRVYHTALLACTRFHKTKIYCLFKNSTRTSSSTCSLSMHLVFIAQLQQNILKHVLVMLIRDSPRRTQKVLIMNSETFP